MLHGSVFCSFLFWLLLFHCMIWHISYYHKLMNIWTVSSLEMRNNVTVGSCTQAFAWTCVFISLGQRCLGVEFLGHVVACFKLLRNDLVAFCSSCTTVWSHQGCECRPSPQHHQHLLLSVLLRVATPGGVRWSLTALLICISLMTNNAELRFLC